MQMYRRRPDVLAAALRDMGVLADGHQFDPDWPSDGEHNYRDN
jgi:hypothetical protein